MEYKLEDRARFGALSRGSLPLPPAPSLAGTARCAEPCSLQGTIEGTIEASTFKKVGLHPVSLTRMLPEPEWGLWAILYVGAALQRKATAHNHHALHASLHLVLLGRMLVCIEEYNPRVRTINKSCLSIIVSGKGGRQL